jgi:hypothetical protein
MADPLTDITRYIEKRLRRLPPVDRVQAARKGALTVGGTFSAIADETVYEMTRSATYPQIAEALGVRRSNINRAVSRHLAATNPKETR